VKQPHTTRPGSPFAIHLPPWQSGGRQNSCFAFGGMIGPDKKVNRFFPPGWANKPKWPQVFASLGRGKRPSRQVPIARGPAQHQPLARTMPSSGKALDHERPPPPMVLQASDRTRPSFADAGWSQHQCPVRAALESPSWQSFTNQRPPQRTSGPGAKGPQGRASESIALSRFTGLVIPLTCNSIGIFHRRDGLMPGSLRLNESRA